MLEELQKLMFPYDNEGNSVSEETEEERYMRILQSLDDDPSSSG